MTINPSQVMIQDAINKKMEFIMSSDNNSSIDKVLSHKWLVFLGVIGALWIASSVVTGGCSSATDNECEYSRVEESKSLTDVAWSDDAVEEGVAYYHKGSHLTVAQCFPDDNTVVVCYDASGDMAAAMLAGGRGLFGTAMILDARSKMDRPGILVVTPQECTKGNLLEAGLYVYCGIKQAELVEGGETTIRVFVRLSEEDEQAELTHRPQSEFSHFFEGLSLADYELGERVGVKDESHVKIDPPIRLFERVSFCRERVPVVRDEENESRSYEIISKISLQANVGGEGAYEAVLSERDKVRRLMEKKFNVQFSRNDRGRSAGSDYVETYDTAEIVRNGKVVASVFIDCFKYSGSAKLELTLDASEFIRNEAAEIRKSNSKSLHKLSLEQDADRL